MKNRASKQTEQQAENEVQQIIALSFEEFTRDAVRRAAWGIMMEEVEALCGPRYRPTRGSAHRRAGTEKGVLRHGARREAIRRPRVRHAAGKGEVALESYGYISSVENHAPLITRMMSEGMSARGMSRASDAALGKSRIAEAWVAKGREHVMQLRQADLRAQQWAALMLDGVWLDKELCAIVALGIDAQGDKQVLDFEVGTSESAECATRLLRRLVERGFGPKAKHRLLSIIDGAAALRRCAKHCTSNGQTSSCRSASCMWKGTRWIDCGAVIGTKHRVCSSACALHKALRPPRKPLWSCTPGLDNVTTAHTQACWQPKNDCSQCINSTSGRACNAACCPPMRLRIPCAIGVKAPTE